MAGKMEYATNILIEGIDLMRIKDKDWTKIFTIQDWESISSKLFEYESIRVFDANCNLPYLQALAHISLKNWEESLSYLNFVIFSDFDAAFANARYYQGKVNMELNNYKEAIWNFNDAIKLKNDFYQAYHNRGIAYKELRDYERALDNFNKVIEINPNFELTYQQIISIYRKKKDFNSAFYFVNEALKHSSEDLYFYFLRALIYLETDNFVKANLDFEKFLGKEISIMLDITKDCELFFVLGLCFEQTDNHENARKYFLKAVEYGFNDKELVEEINKLKK